MSEGVGGAHTAQRIMVHGREPYDAKTIAMLHDRRMAAGPSGSFLRAESGRASDKPTLLRYAPERTLSQTDLEFISRMDVDVESRRHNVFIAEVKKDPRFRPSMLEPPSSFVKVRRTIFHRSLECPPASPGLLARTFCTRLLGCALSLSLATGVFKALCGMA